MLKLLKNDFYRMSKEKSHLILLAVMLGYSVLIFTVMFIWAKTENVSDTGMQSGMAVAGAISNVSLFAVLSASITIGGELRARTINLKILAGHSRLKIFMSAAITAIAVATVMFLITVGFGVGGAYALFGGFGDRLDMILRMLPAAYLATIAYVTVSLVITFWLKPTLGLIINVLIIMVIAGLLSVVAVLLAQYKFFEVLFDALPYTSSGTITNSVLTGQLSDTLLTRSMIGSAVVILLSTVGGWLIFRRRSLT